MHLRELRARWSCLGSQGLRPAKSYPGKAETKQDKGRGFFQGKGVGKNHGTGNGSPTRSTDVPEGTEEEYGQGWIDNYWEPLKTFLKEK